MVDLGLHGLVLVPDEQPGAGAERRRQNAEDGQRELEAKLHGGLSGVASLRRPV